MAPLLMKDFVRYRRAQLRRSGLGSARNRAPRAEEFRRAPPLTPRQIPLCQKRSTFGFPSWRGSPTNKAARHRQMKSAPSRPSMATQPDRSPTESLPLTRPHLSNRPLPIVPDFSAQRTEGYSPAERKQPCKRPAPTTSQTGSNTASQTRVQTRAPFSLTSLGQTLAGKAVIVAGASLFVAVCAHFIVAASLYAGALDPGRFRRTAGRPRTRATDGLYRACTLPCRRRRLVCRCLRRTAPPASYTCSAPPADTCSRIHSPPRLPACSSVRSSVCRATSHPLSRHPPPAC